uniref:Major facilitator superfamily (MFS) profile domain-containing protein n=1 Tax=Panagrolaimus davidi TaxID=227884 RepID=A0A914Q570_9BILA
MSSHDYSPNETTSVPESLSSSEVSSNSGSTTSEVSNPRSVIITLFLIGSVLTCATNCFSSFSHAGLNEAVLEVDNFINESYVQRGAKFSDGQVTLIRDVLMSSWYAGQVPGGLMSPIITDRWGRKGAYLLATGMMTLAMTLQATATAIHLPEMLLLGRLVASFFSPMSDAVAIMYLQEISPTKLRGVLSSLFNGGYAVMALLGIILGMDALLGNHITVLLSIPVVLGLLALPFLLWLPETPKFLMISSKNPEKALKSLEFFQGKKLENGLILEQYLREAESEPTNKDGGTMTDLFKVWYLRKALILSLGVLVLTLPFFAILQSSTHFFLFIQLPKDFAQLSSTLLMVAFVFSSFIASGLIKRFGRRSLILTFGILSILCLGVFVGAAAFIHKISWSKYIALAGMTGYILCYGLAIGPISWFIPAELVPLKYRASMICVCQSLNSVSIAITGFSTIPLFNVKK